MRKIIMDEKQKAYYRLPRIRNKRWTMLIGIVLLAISFVCFSYGLYNLIRTTMVNTNALWYTVVFSGFTTLCRVLAPLMILTILIYEIRSLVDLIRRVRLADKE